jgi:hypothetical protein
MLLGAIKHENGTKLLYAAQVALATVPRESTGSTHLNCYMSGDE